MVFVGCGKEKRRQKSPALSLYTGTYFRTCLAVARRLATDDRIFVLSAKYGVLHSTDQVEPYDLKLDMLSKSQKAAWVAAARVFVEEKLLEGFTPVFVCGKSYNGGLPGIKLLPEVGMGEQMRFMRSLLDDGQYGFF